MKIISKILVSLFLVILLLPNFSRSEEEKVNSRLRKVLLASLIPGGGHFYLRDYKTGCGYLSLELALLTLGYKLNPRLAKGEQNIFYLSALKIYELSQFTSYRQALIKYSPSAIDKTPVWKLFLSPFKWENIKSPYIWSCGVVSVILNFLESHLRAKKPENFNKIKEVQIMGVNYPKEKGFFIYQLLSILVSLEAAVSEECVYRGIIQTTWQSAFGKKKGLILSAILFGLLHVTRPQEPLYWYYGLMASLGGIYFGWLYEKDNYCLSRPIAGHFWFNALAFATTFLVKPTLNPLGVKVRF